MSSHNFFSKEFYFTEYKHLPFDSSTALVPILAGISPKKAGGGVVISN